MGIEKFIIEQKIEEFKIFVNKEEFIIKVRPLTWSMRNKALSEAMKIQGDGSLKVDIDSYSKYILCARIVEAPWGPTSFTFLNTISPEIGSQLENLVPHIWGAEKKEEDETKNALDGSLSLPSEK